MSRIIVLMLLIFPLSSWAVIETYQFESEQLQVRYQHFTEELRCPKCQNQNLSGSNSPIAADLRREIHRLLHEGRSDQEITQFMVDRYGEFVLYRPRFNPQTAILWFAPVIFLLIGGLFLVALLYRQRRRNKAYSTQQHAEALSPSEQQQLDNILKGRNDG